MRLESKACVNLHKTINKVLLDRNNNVSTIAIITQLSFRDTVSTSGSMRENSNDDSC